MSDRSLHETCYRLIPSHFPPIALFENLLDASELDAAYALEALTNDRIRDQAGLINMVPPHDRIVGPGSTPIMAAFTHINIESRFTKGGYGVYYAGLSLKTAIKESSFSRARFYRSTNEPSAVITMRCYVCDVKATLEDVRTNRDAHHPTDFSHAQALGEQAKKNNKQGLLYKSVRHQGGECIAILKPKALIPPAAQAGTYQYFWDGKRVTDIVEITQVK